MIDFTLAELLTGLDLSDNVGDMTDNLITLQSSGRLVLNGEPVEADASFRGRLIDLLINLPGSIDPEIYVATGYRLDAIGMRNGLIRDGYFYEATEVSAEKPE